MTTSTYRRELLTSGRAVNAALSVLVAVAAAVATVVLFPRVPAAAVLLGVITLWYAKNAVTQIDTLVLGDLRPRP